MIIKLKSHKSEAWPRQKIIEIISRFPTQSQCGLKSLLEEADRDSCPDNLYLGLGQTLLTTFQEGSLSRRELLQLSTVLASSGIFHLLFPKISHAGGVFPFGFWGSGSRTQASLDNQGIYRVLMIKGDGAATGPIHSLIDSSNNNYSITKQGTPVQGAFSPFSAESGKWSYSFNGSSDLLTISSGSLFGIGSTDFTVEAWIYPTSFNAIWHPVLVVGITSGFWFGKLDNGGFGIRAYGVANLAYSATLPTLYKWTHVAACRSGSTIRLFYDGVQVASATSANNFPAGPSYFGSDSAGSYFSGQISNLRLVMGNALYTANFTPSTTPLTAVSGTALLTAQDNRFKDNSTNNFSMISTGVPKVIAMSPFTSSFTSYSPSTQGGSEYFSGYNSGQYLVIPNSNAMNLGTADWTFECWLYFTDSNNIYKGIIGKRANNVGWTCALTNEAAPRIMWYSSSVGNAIAPSGSTSIIPRSTWAHCAWVRRSGIIYLYVNGIQAHSIADSIGDNTYDTSIAVSQNVGSTGELFGGYISNLRFVKGVGVYTGNFSPPIKPLTTEGATSASCYSNTTNINTTFSSSSTSLLLNFTNSDLIDHSRQNQVTSVGTPVQGAFSPFSIEPGKWSCYFDGTGDSLTVPDQAGFNLSNSDFTIEAWVNVTRSASTWGMEIITNVDTSDHNWGFCINRNTSSARISFFMAGVVTLADTSSSVFPAGWHHVAVTRSGSNFKLFLDGVQVVTASSSANYTHYSQPLYIGNDVYGNSFTGHISNVRVIKGTALYTSNFTPPTSPLTAVTNTVFLACQDNRFKDNSTNNFTITSNGDSRIVPFGPFQTTTTLYTPSVHGGSVYLNGTTDYVTLQLNSDALALSNADFTVEAWVFPTLAGNRTIIIGQCDMSTAAGSSFVFYGDSSRTSDLYVGSGSYPISSPNCILNQWNHVAFVRTGGTFSSYLNGTRVGTRSDLGTASVNTGTTTYLPAIGACSNAIRLHTGYLSDVRLIKGIGGYDATQSTLTIPTQPLSNKANTTVLMSFANAPIIDATRKNNLMRTGTTQIRVSSKKYGTGSLYFDGSSNLSFLNSHALFDFGYGDYTIEFWINYVVKNSANNIFVPVDYGSGISGAFQIVSESAGNLGIYTWGGGSADGWIATYPLSNFSTGTWYHVAFTRYNGTTNLYINGTNVSTSTKIYTGNYGNISLYIGGKTAQFLNAYLDNFTILKGKALYTGSSAGTTYFTPSNVSGY